MTNDCLKLFLMDNIVNYNLIIKIPKKNIKLQVNINNI